MRILILALLALTSCNEQPDIRKESPENDVGKIFDNRDSMNSDITENMGDMETILNEVEEIAIDKDKGQELVAESLSLKITDSEHTGFGFEILQGSSPLIIQPHIPAIQGIKGFDTKEQAAIIGNYMIYKINNGIMPPSISVQDLDSLEIPY
jgi:hypothetical protein